MTPPPISASQTSTGEGAYDFGRNWWRYVRAHLTPERERIAERSLRDLLEIDLEGRSFLDIGSGSGIFSLAAYRLGAALVVSVDVDPESVASCVYLRRREGDPANWEVRQGSILDPVLIAGLDPADIVYAWGVLHHTGEMEGALRNAAALVAPGGLLAIAIYNNATQGPVTSARWLRIKRRYNRSSRVMKFLMEAAYRVYWLQRALRRGRNPLREARDYKRARGMALSTDISDWLGGYPYEFAAADEIVSFCERELGLRAKKVASLGPRDPGNNEFVFERPGKP